MKKEKKKRLRRIAERCVERRRRKQISEVTGILHVSASGFGFLELDAEQDGKKPDDFFVPAKFINRAIDGDHVRAEIVPPRHDHPEDFERGPVVRVKEVLARSRTEIVGELIAGAKIRPLNRRLPDGIEVHGARKGAARGDWVTVKLDENHSGIWSGSIRRVIGRSGVISADLDAVMEEFKLLPRYSEVMEQEAQTIVPREIEREDCRELFAVTIDPFDAKDFDDAVSLAPSKKTGCIELGIHIADVAAFIAPRSKFDEAAMKRGFSCYLPGRTLPMLPAGLTAKISMRADEDSIAHSVFLTVDRQTGAVVDARRTHTVIRVRHRLDYDTVQKFIDTGKTPKLWDKTLKTQISALVDLTRKMRQYRSETEKFIDLPLPEVRVLCDEKSNQLQGISVRIARESENLIEECMLAANQAVGNELGTRGIAGIFRVHPEPPEDKTTEFSDSMQEDFGLYPGNIADRSGCRRFITSLPDDGRRSVILGLLLRAMSRASYSVRPDLHFALGKVRYCHFTSPIRRYTDLVVHQQLWNFDQHARTRSANTLDRVAQWCSEQEENVDAAGFAANDRLKLRILEEELEKSAGKIYEGVIVRTVAGGVQVEISELGIYGFVQRERLHGSFRRRGSRLEDDERGKSFRPGNYIYLRLDNIDFARGSANFVPAGR